MRARVVVLMAIAIVAALVPLAASAARKTKPPKSKSVEAVVREHIDAVEDCDAARLVAGYSRDAKLFFPDGVVVEGQAALRDLYADFVKPQPEGGLCGITVTREDSYRRAGTIFVKFRVEAPFLAEPYFSTDGYVIAHGKILSEVSTFDASKLVFE
jgi:hypothetical protein